MMLALQQRASHFCADPHSVGAVQGITPLFLACWNGGFRIGPTGQTDLDLDNNILRGTDIIEALLVAGADPNAIPPKVKCVTP